MIVQAFSIEFRLRYAQYQVRSNALEVIMLKFILGFAGFGPRAPEGADCEPWRFDPLTHPALRSMNQAQLGDLPIGHPAARQAHCGC